MLRPWWTASIVKLIFLLSNRGMLAAEQQQSLVGRFSSVRQRWSHFGSFADGPRWINEDLRIARPSTSARRLRLLRSSVCCLLPSWYSWLCIASAFHFSTRLLSCRVLLTLDNWNWHGSHFVICLFKINRFFQFPSPTIWMRDRYSLKKTLNCLYT